MNHKIEYLRATGAALAMVTALALTGCFSNPLSAITDQVSEEVAKGGAEKLLDEITGDDTNIQFGEIPDGFPKEITLVSTNVIQGATVKTENGTTMSVTVADPRTLPELADQVKSDFADWEEVSWIDMQELMGGTFKKGDSLTVTVGFLGDGSDDTMVSYTVHVSG